MKQKQNHMVSLRTRFISLALVLGTLLITGTIISNKHSSQIREDAFAQLSSVSEQSVLVHEIRTRIINAHRYLNLFLLAINQDINKVQYSLNITSALQKLQQLQALSNTENNDLIKNLELLIDELNNEVKRIFIIRINPRLQYPSMEIAFNQMRPSRKTISGALAIAIKELETDAKLINEPEVYSGFYQIQKLWTGMLSEFRIYVANRMISFHKEGLKQHENNIEDYYVELVKEIARLKILDKNKQLTFEESNAIAEILRTLHKWKSSYHEVKTIHNSKYWRADSLIMNNTIMPLMDQLLAYLQDLDLSLKDQSKIVVTNLSNVAKNQNIILVGVILFFIFYMLATLLSIENLIFKPVTAIADALKTKFTRHDTELQQYAKTSETKILVDAFAEMQLQVSSREKELEYQALHDELTGLPNRTMLTARIEKYLAAKQQKILALLILDLNQFKEVNDTLGHHIGDQLLIQVGERFHSSLRSKDIIVRLGGDEFAILLPDSTAEQATEIAEKINHSIENTFKINEYRLHVGVSIGIAVYPRDGDNLHTLMQHADVAMYIAKRNNLSYSLYNPDEDKNSLGRLSLVPELKKALQENKLELYFQPKFSLKNNKISGAEALLRWNHPEFGFVNPECIIELAEQVDLIHELTKWIVDQAIAYCCICHQSGYTINIAINLSVQNLRNNDICVIVKDCLKKYHIDSQYITLEITESAMMTNPQRSLEVLQELSRMGITLSIDDFGTGFSSLAYLKKFPVQELKIDKSFIMEMNTDCSNDVIVRSTIELGHNLGLKVVAEGIEQQVIYQTLQTLGCDTAQGYLMSKPLEKQIFSDWLKENFRPA